MAGAGAAAPAGHGALQGAAGREAGEWGGREGGAGEGRVAVAGAEGGLQREGGTAEHCQPVRYTRNGGDLGTEPFENTALVHACTLGGNKFWVGK